MASRRFEVNFTAVLEVDDAVITRGLDPEFKREITDLVNAEGVARHLAFNLARGAELQALDGWADMPDAKARILDFDCDEAWESKRVKGTRHA